MQVSHIDPASPIKLHLYAENAKGTSEPAVIDDALSSQHKHYVEGDGDDDDDDDDDDAGDNDDDYGDE